MNPEPQYFPGNEKESQKPTDDQSGNKQQEVDISLPHTERPVGPFEHSGETARQTKAEEAENEDAEAGEHGPGQKG